jgi:hypothetical protein
MKLDFGRILTRAWHITWKNKALWLFGFFIALTSESASGGSNALNLRNQISNADLSGSSEFLPPEIRNFIEWINHIDWNSAWVYVAVAFGCVFIIWILLILLSIRGHGGLISAIVKADSGEIVTVREAWTIGGRYFWRLLAINVIHFLAAMAMGSVAFLVIFGSLMLSLFGYLSDNRASAVPILLPLLILCPMYCCVFAGSIILSFYMYFAKLAVVIEDLKIGASFRRAWQVIKGSIGPLILIGGIVYVLTLGMGVLSLLWTAPAAGLFLAGIWPMLNELGMINMPLLYLAGLLLLISVPIGWLVSAVWVTWSNAVYTLVYRQLTLSPADPAVPQ